MDTACQCYDETDEGEVKPSSQCFGDCWDWQKDEARNLIRVWQELNEFDDDTLIKVEGSEMGWLRQSGFAECLSNPERITELLSLNAEFRLEFELIGKTLTARRWSHDEPTGTGLFTFSLVE